MPQNTPMKRQFTTIDGRTVMSNLPQHWGGNDWKITGVDNPLPVGNYVQTDSGVWIPQKGSDDGAADVRVTGSSTALEMIKNSVVNLEPEQELVSDYFDNTLGNFSNFFINLYRAGQNNWQIIVEISSNKSGHWRSVIRREVLTPLEGEYQTLKGFDLAPYYINFRLKNTGSSISTFYNVIVTFTR